MSQQTASQVSVTIEWDDSVMMVFSFQGASSSTVYCGFPHVALALQGQTGTQTQVTAKVQAMSQSGVQLSADPGTWVETVKYGARGNKITIDYDDSTNVNYTPQVGNPYQLQLLYSIRG